MTAPIRMSVAFFLALLSIGAGTAAGDDFERQLLRHLYPPELLMEHGETIGIAVAQRDAVKEAIRTAQAEVVEIQWEMMASQRALIEAVSAKQPDPAEVSTRAKRLLELEGRIKMRHLSLLVEIKNLLSDEQQVRLDELRTEVR